MYLFIKCLLVVFCCSRIYGSESSEELQEWLAHPLNALILREALTDAYNHDKLEYISSLLSQIKDDIGNITLVATENIYGPNEEIVEIRTVELHISSIMKKEMFSSLNGESSDDSSDFTVTGITAVFQLIYVVVFDMNIAGVEFTEDGKLEQLMYMDKDTMYAFTEGIHLLNKTIQIDTLEEAEREIAKIKKDHPLFSIHAFDENHKIILDKSKIDAALSAKVISEEGETNQKLLDDILAAVITSLLETNNNHSIAPAKTVEYLKEKYPDTEFYVFPKEPYSWYLKKDYFRVSIEYDMALFYDEQLIIYSVFGLKEEKQ